MLFFSRTQENVVIKNILTALLLGTLVTSCSFNSDPTSKTKYNFKNGKEKLTPDTEKKQWSSAQCMQLLNVQIDSVHYFADGNTTSDTLTAHSLLKGLETELKIVPSDRNPPGLKLIKTENEIGEYKFSWDTSLIKTNKNLEVYYIELAHVTKGKNSIEAGDCQISSLKNKYQ